MIPEHMTAGSVRIAKLRGHVKAGFSKSLMVGPRRHSQGSGDPLYGLASVSKPLCSLLVYDLPELAVSNMMKKRVCVTFFM